MFRKEYARNVQAVGRIDARKQRADVLMYGDSITAWNKPMDLSKLPGSRRWFTRHFGDLVSEPLGIPGDEIKHLYWRLAIGDELPRHEDPRHVILLIGINDVVHGVSEDDIVSRMDALVEFVVGRLPTSNILLQLLLPSHRDVSRVNEGYRKVAEKHERVVVSTCLSELSRGSNEWRRLMVDELHPNEEGQNRLLECLRRHVDAVSGECRLV